MKINITIHRNGNEISREYEAKITLRAMMGFEKITEKAFEIKTLSDIITYCYCIIIANNDTDMTGDEFIEALDYDPTLMQSFNELLQDKKKEVEKLQEQADRA